MEVILSHDECYAHLEAVGFPLNGRRDWTCDGCDKNLPTSVPHIHGEVIQFGNSRYIAAYCSEGCAIKDMADAHP